MEYAALNNGVKMPMLGYGVYQIPPEQTKECVAQAIRAGYRSLDTAQGYMNEAAVGDAVAESGIPRKEFFLTSKIWISNAGEERAYKSILKTLERLRTDYIDLMLIHQNFGDVYGSYRALERAYKEGKVRAIGLSNFMPDRFLDIVSFNDVKPAVIQLEVHAFYQQKDFAPIAAEFGTQLMAWSPLAEGRNGLFTNLTLTNIGKKYGKTAAQVNLRFLVQSGVIVIPKSVHRERMEENFNLFDFKLTDSDMDAVRALDLNKSQFIDFRAVETAKMFIGAGAMKV